MSIYEEGLHKRPANHAPLTPNGFIGWAARVFPDRPAVAYAGRIWSYRQFRDRSYRLAHALHRLGVGPGDTVTVLAPNTPQLLECHFGVPLLGAVLNAVNARLDGPTVGFILDHAESKVFLVDPELVPTARAALETATNKPILLSYQDPVLGEADPFGDHDYESLIAAADPTFTPPPIEDEWQAIALNYTSGTTGDPKGVVYHHRGAYLVGINNQFGFRLDPLPTYLWTLPMFHCNGWGNTWAITKLAGLHVCLRALSADAIFEAIDAHQVTHMSGAPVILTMLINAPEAQRRKSEHTIHYTVGGAPPPAAVLEKMAALNFNVTHQYGLTETYGPAGGCEWNPAWDALPIAEQAEKKKRQGVPNHTLEDMTVLDPERMTPTRADAAQMGEIMMRGNTIMKGYLKNPAATEAVFKDGWFHSGDLGVLHPDRYVELRDRSKDIIISGGENIPSLEVEGVLFRHPDIMEAAIVAAPHPKWGETPIAFVTLKDGAEATEAEIIQWCRDRLAHFKAPTRVLFGPLPKTSTGKVRKGDLRERVVDGG